MKATTAVFALFLSVAAVATPLSTKGNTQAPLADLLFASHPGLDIELDALHLLAVELEGQDEPVAMTELEKIQLKSRGAKFFDITETPNLGTNARLRALQRPSYPAPNNTEAVRSVIDILEVKNLEDWLRTFTRSYTRYYRSVIGKQKIAEITETFALEFL